MAARWIHPKAIAIIWIEFLWWLSGEFHPPQRNELLAVPDTFIQKLQECSEPVECGVFIDESQLQQHAHKLQAGGLMPGKQLASTFAMLRANDLIWSYVVNNYLKGKTPPPFDIL